MASIRKVFVKNKTNYSIKLKFTSNKIDRYLSYKPIKIPLTDFDLKKENIKRSSKIYFELSTKMNELDSKINTALEVVQFKKEITAQELKDLFLGAVLEKQNPKKLINSISFFAFSEKLQNELKSLGKNGNAQAYYYATLKLKKFYVYDLALNEMTYAILIDMKNHYLAQGEKINTVSTHLSKLRAIYNEACNRYDYNPEVMPFKKGLIVYQKTRKKNLEPGILLKLKNLELKGTQERVRDLFLLSFYLRGLDVMDILTIKQSDISKDYLISKRKKLGDKDSGFFKIKIEPEAQNIIDKYKEPGTLHLLPFYKQDHSTEKGWKNYNTVVNNLRRAKNNLLKQHELDIDLTFKSIRHSWATIARQCYLPYDVIQACMAHKNTDVTDIYIEYDQKQLDDANRVVIDCVFLIKK